MISEFIMKIPSMFSNEYSFIFLIFFIYSVFGYLCEVTYCFFLNKFKFENRGFLYGPYCPIYGYGVVILVLFLEKYMYSPLILFMMICIYSAILEYITSYIMEKLFNNKWWDYSTQKFNINGRVCLLNLILFGILGLVICYFINPHVVKFIDSIPIIIQNILAYALTLVIIIDTIKSTKVALTLKDKLQNIHDETNKIIEEEYKKLSQIQRETMELLTEKMRSNVSNILHDKNSKKINYLIRKLPATKADDCPNSKLRTITALKNYIFVNKESKEDLEINKEEETPKNINNGKIR